MTYLRMLQNYKSKSYIFLVHLTRITAFIEQRYNSEMDFLYSLQVTFIKNSHLKYLCIRNKVHYSSQM